MKNNFGFLITALSLCLASGVTHGAEAKLKVGDAAPKLQTGKWIQGEPVKSLEKGKTYMVEFWATWCGPCRTSIPHVNDLQEKFKDKNFIVIGQDVWERDEAAVKPFVEKMGSKMTYRVALDDKSSDEDGAMATTWMKAAGQDGIPSAFLVDKEGKIAWIGHPMTLKESVIEAVLAGTYDLKKAAAAKETEEKNQEKIGKLAREFSSQLSDEKWDEADATLAEIKKLIPADEQEQLENARMPILLGKGDYDGAAKVATKMTKDVTDPMMLNQVAWGLLIKPVTGEALDSAFAIAERANKAADGKDAAILDTYARALWMKGQKEKALELQEKAVKLADDEDVKRQLQDSLNSYKEGKLPKAE